MRRLNVMLFASALALAPFVGAQTPAAAAPAQPVGPQVGDAAPDFTLPASTKDGKLAQPIHLAALKGQVVVLAFFPRARTSG
jgi:peroxiredoxin Q/BCP